VTAISASDPGKPGFQNPAIQIPINYLFGIGAKKAVLSPSNFIKVFLKFCAMEKQNVRKISFFPLEVSPQVSFFNRFKSKKQIPIHR
jgi:hypothetical protein|tara:strand:+ start:57187 stop:57447 length:261 start_codon:yes stop_codon:yes gene_type:complete